MGRPRGYGVVVLLLLVIGLASPLAATADETATKSPLGKTWVLYHSLGGGDDSWIRRGTVTLSIDSDDADSADDQKEQPTEKGSDAVKLVVENDEGCLSDTAVESLMADDWYRLKLEEEGEENKNTVMTTVSSCQVRRAGFRDEMILTFGTQGRVVSFSYIPLVSPLAPKSCSDLPPPKSDGDSTLRFKSRISYETAVPGMTLRTVLPTYQPPPGLKFISNKNTVAGAATKDDGKGKAGSFGNPDENGEAKPEEQFDSSPFGFLKRYWYIIVPMMLMNIMGGGGEEAPKEGQQGGGEGQAGAAVAPGPAAATPRGGGGGGKRRGKRG